MIEDGNLLFSSNQTISTAGTTVSTNILDFGVEMDLGITERPTQVFVAWSTMPVGSSPGTTTVQYALQSSTTPTGPWVTLDQSGPLLTTGITTTTNPLDLTPGMHRYAQVVYTVASGSLTAGNVTSGLVLDADGGQKYYKRAYQA